MMTTAFIPSADGLRALVAAHPGITKTELARKIGCNAPHLGRLLERYGIELRHGVRKDTDERRTLQYRKIQPSKKPVHRPCICCGAGFKSEHVGHRMCADCRRENPSE